MNPLEYCKTYKIRMKLLASMGDCLPTSGGLDTSLISLPRKRGTRK